MYMKSNENLLELISKAKETSTHPLYFIEDIFYPSDYLHEAYCPVLLSHAICVQSIHTRFTFNQYRLHIDDYIIRHTHHRFALLYYFVFWQFLINHVLGKIFFPILLELHPHFYIDAAVELSNHLLPYVDIIEIYFFVFHDHHWVFVHCI